VLRRYTHSLRDADGSLKLVVSEKRVLDQIEASGLADELGARNIYRSTEWIGETVRRAYADALDEQRR
jgi:SulP family sulfate permease